MGKKIYTTILLFFALIIVVVGFYIIGSPFQAKQQRLDETRVGHLQSLDSHIEDYYYENKELPGSLKGLKDGIEADILINSSSSKKNTYRKYNILIDPVTKKSYGYKKTGQLTYKLCANFSTKTTENFDQNGFGVSEKWLHPKGKHCFNKDVKDIKKRIESQNNY